MNKIVIHRKFQKNLCETFSSRILASGKNDTKHIQVQMLILSYSCIILIIIISYFPIVLLQ